MFLRHPGLVAVARALADHPSLAATLDACGVIGAQRVAFAAAVEQLARSGIVRERTG